MEHIIHTLVAKPMPFPFSNNNTTAPHQFIQIFMTNTMKNISNHNEDKLKTKQKEEQKLTR